MLIAQNHDRCLVCGGPPAGMGIFEPTPLWLAKHSLPTGQTLGYAVCERHLNLNDQRSLAMVEMSLEDGLEFVRN